MPEKMINKIVYGGQTLIDLTGDTVTEEKVLAGFKFHGADGAIKTGTCKFDVDSSEVTASQAEVLTGKSFAKNGEILTGTMPNVGAQSGSITTKEQEVTITRGYHDGSGKIGIDASEQAKLLPENIKEGLTILGVVGSYTGSELIHATSATITPKITAQTILPTDLGEYNYISEINVEAIPYSEVENSAGGMTVTIGAAA